MDLNPAPLLQDLRDCSICCLNHTVWYFYIALEIGPLIDVLPITNKMVMFHSYVLLPEGMVDVHCLSVLNLVPC